MLSIVADNVNEAFSVTMMHFRQAAAANKLIKRTTRGQNRWQYPTPVATTYRRPRERVLFDVTRDANPFFHFMESLWILAGRSDVAWLSQWLAKIAEFSDDGIDFHGAYGYRMHNHHQLEEVVKKLSKDPDSTRAVISLYDPAIDADYSGKDLPCNCTLFLGLQDGKLNLTVANRSNDMIWGAYGANVVQFSMIQEYIAGLLGAEMGWYTQFSNNAHIYPDVEVTKKILAEQTPVLDPYHADHLEAIRPYPMFYGARTGQFQDDLAKFMGDTTYATNFQTPFFRWVVMPMMLSHHFYRERRYEEAILNAERIVAEDWSNACVEWLRRRKAKAAK